MYYKFNKETLLFEKTKISNVTLLGLGALLGLALVLGFTSNGKNGIEYLSQEEKIIVVREYNEFSEEKLIKKIQQLNFRFPHIILAQAKLESGHFKSGIFLENNNMFGMREAKLRSNLAKGTNRAHAYYDSWQDSVLDYALYYSTYLYKIKTEGEYFEYLRQNYAEDPTYVQRLKQIIKKQDLKNRF
ncbi:mannosyl-glycoprotein endo-beta-N-acetylglucosaminidase [Flavobacterium phage vB_FspM_immuto_2-6A]|jgi:uncharacterized FlgJ-related protein|uniref:Mannosyl-glycoprotein endo-beta-N-acetylglucosaminidase n=1 Tax=Flavobacterium phage vB_FspM_immuto_2-6A TaxID=2801477 RepID=A0A7T8IX34_9CAUD|nr:endolysin [Flavobacterium phage vB_FspM_immuto_2-6A]QQO91714.1 mannosyl-glycoprotein endo-beta-N-acetylglucosaminidase [Flavobacterium phage vB_FspM_immuto_2-6A]